MQHALLELASVKIKQHKSGRVLEPSRDIPGTKYFSFTCAQDLTKVEQKIKS